MGIPCLRFGRNSASDCVLLFVVNYQFTELFSTQHLTAVTWVCAAIVRRSCAKHQVTVVHVTISYIRKCQQQNERTQNIGLILDVDSPGKYSYTQPHKASLLCWAPSPPPRAHSLPH